ncbi:MAG: Uma2 family endonuclease [Tildeniella nuda ZEHNDER 1965/U140]|jgi:Uma2 family endonuclease|nr:Uma2 family endonuclease [Tildeniella nuda ZEHNDER 1965/U140]
MNWQEVCDNKALQDLPFKIELNKWGQIVMSPVKVKHSFFQGRIQSLLESLLSTGTVMPELAIQTTDGVKVADVVWVSDRRLDVIEEETAASIAPEICVEVKSASNTLEEMLVKKELYLGAGAVEVWLCGKSGVMSFYNQQGQLDASLLVPDFPNLIQRKT